MAVPRSTGAVPAGVVGPFSGVSIVVPTYREAENLPHLVERIERLRRASGLDIELLIMDDDSQDGTEQWFSSIDAPWARLVVRKKDRGLSQAVVEGLRMAKHEALVVMDADLSHPPEAIVDLLRALADGADFVMGSRYVDGGSTDAEWGALRWLNSKAAVLLARPLTRARDPMSGFFALTRTTFSRGEAELDPIGYKIGLELIVKCRCQRVVEHPIYFQDRKLGKSKLNLAEQLRYLVHVGRLYRFRYGASRR